MCQFGGIGGIAFVEYSMAIKLLKASKILRTGMYDLVAFCRKEGIPVKEYPNFRIEDKYYLKMAKKLNPYIAYLIESKRSAAQKYSMGKSAQNWSPSQEKKTPLGLSKTF